MSARTRTWQILEATKPGDITAKLVNFLLLGLVFLNVLAVIMGTVEALQIKYHFFLDIFEIISIIIFCVEYAGRMWACVEDKRFEEPLFGRIRYALHFMTLLDLAAILPFFYPIHCHGYEGNSNIPFAKTDTNPKSGSLL